MTMEDATRLMDMKSFVKIWRFLCDRWNRKTDEHEAMAYYQWLQKRGMDYEQFASAAETLWATREFFPRPVDFLLVQANTEWGRVLSVLGLSGENERIVSYNSLSDRAREAFNSLGGSEGLNRMGVPRARQAFLEAFEAVVATEALENAGALASVADRPPKLVARKGSSGAMRRAIAEPDSPQSPNALPHAP